MAIAVEFFLFGPSPLGGESTLDVDEYEDVEVFLECPGRTTSPADLPIGMGSLRSLPEDDTDDDEKCTPRLLPDGDEDKSFDGRGGTGGRSLFL